MRDGAGKEQKRNTYNYNNKVLVWGAVYSTFTNRKVDFHGDLERCLAL